MRILGIDPGTQNMGYGLLDGESRMVECGVLTARRRQELPLRLLHLHQQLLELIDRLNPEEIAVEEPFIPRTDRDVRTAISVGQAQAVALIAAAARGLPVHRYLPAQVRSVVVGYGAGTKAQVQEMVRLQLGLDRAPQSQDAADALAVALCHLRQRRIAQLSRLVGTAKAGGMEQP